MYFMYAIPGHGIIPCFPQPGCFRPLTWLFRDGDNIFHQVYVKKISVIKDAYLKYNSALKHYTLKQC